MKAYPRTHTPPRDHTLVRWMIQQCLGVSLGLREIHNNPVNNSQSHIQKQNTDGKNHGRHGDLKPENILWFRSSDNNLFGTLKVSDFGLVDFHRTQSKSEVPRQNLLGMTPTYRAPEWDVKKQVAQSYDIWCIGCVFLEFVEWFLNGKQGVEEFIDKRLMDSITPANLPIQQDNFFNLKQATNSADLGEAIAKESVRNVSRRAQTALRNITINY
jgi:serine/threonine protein kinase